MDLLSQLTKLQEPLILFLQEFAFYPSLYFLVQIFFLSHLLLMKPRVFYAD